MMSLQSSACSGGSIALVHPRVTTWLFSQQDWAEFMLCFAVFCACLLLLETGRCHTDITSQAAMQCKG